MQKVSKNIEETAQIAKEFLSKIKPDKKTATIVALCGDLGVGKTAFTQVLARELGIKRKVNSPTYVIVKNYKIKAKNYKLFFHIDAYRLKNEKELAHLGWPEIIQNPEHLVFIEWPGRIQKALPKKHHKIEISHTKEGHRKFKIKKY